MSFQVEPHASALSQHAEARRVLDRLGALAWAIDAKTMRSTFVSRELSRRLGLSTTESAFERIVHPLDRAAIEADCLEVARTRVPRAIDYRAVAADGRVTRFVGELRPLSHDAGGAVTEVVTILVELPPESGERARIEAALRESEGRYEELYNKTPAMMHSIDRHGRLVSVSDAWLRTLGYERDEVIGRRSVDFLTEASRRYAEEEILPEYFRTGICTDVPYGVRTKSGDVIDVLLSAIAERDPDGAHKRSLAVLVDVTQRNRVERERDRLLASERMLRESAESALALLDTLFRSAPVGLAFLDRDLHYVRINDSISKIHAAPPGASIGKTVFETVPALADIVVPILRRVIESGQPITNVDITGLVPAGEIRSLLASYYPVRTHAGEVIGVGVVAVDVTAEKRAAALQEQLYREAQDAVRVRDDFLAVASHELRTPLTPLALSLRLIQGKVRAGEPFDAALVDRAIRQLAKLTGLIGDLLDLSRIQRGGLALQFARVGLRALVEEAVELARSQSVEHTFELDAREELHVMGDERRLGQVVSNLLENAIKYSPPGTTVRVTLTRVGSDARLTVEDHGIGIPPEQLSRVFDRFFRAENAPVTHYGGLGLGLSISRDIVERHGGRIHATSELGVGSTFEVVLPLSET